ncbi:MAG: tetrahydrofolate dehydrogenase/cyclohydrolase catalytic domain-containing protein [bacterium]
MIIDGKKIAADLRVELKEKIAKSGIKPGLGIVFVGDDEGSEIYTRQKMRASEEAGIHAELFRLPASAKKSDILKTVNLLNMRADIHGIIVQLPLPRPEEADEVIAAIDPKKDADGYHSATLQALRDGKRGIIPVMSRVILRAVEECKLDLHGKSVVLVARNPSFIEGQKILLEERGARLVSVSPDNKKMPELAGAADLLIAAGRTEKLITTNMVKNGAVVIDIGIIKNFAGNTVGCVDFANVEPKCLGITPVPGGVGPMTVAYLLWNTFDLATIQDPSASG